MAREVPFIPNTDDELHCLQVAFMMVLQYFAPEKAPPMEEWDTITGFEAGKGTVPTAGLIWFYKHGFDVISIEQFDYTAYAERGAAYILERYPELGEHVIATSNVPLEQERARQFAALPIAQDRNPELQDIKDALDEGYLVCVNLNSKQLNGLPGYTGHFVVIFAYDADSFTLHDPGPPPTPRRNVLFADFEKAWRLEDDQSAEMYALRLKTST